MPYKQRPDIDTKSFLAYTASLLLLGHGFFLEQHWKSKRRNTMNNIIKSTLALGVIVAAAVLTSTAEAEIHSRSKDLVVMEARDLPEQAQARGNSLFLHSDNAGSTYLYVEQQQGF
jgi:hypothetical protein